MDPITGLLVLVVTLFSSFPLVRRLFREEDVLTALTISFVFGLSSILLPLYIVGILLGHGIVVTSWIIFLICAAFFLVNMAKFAPRVPEYLGRLKSILKNARISTLDCILIAAIAALLFKYFYILSIKAIIDFDATSYYIPFARRIYLTDSIPLSGYDYEPYLKPMGIGVLYGWIFSLGGSPYDESFRFFPILFVVITMMIIYALGTRFGSSKTAKIAVIVYTLLPLHDAVFYYASYYADLCYVALILAVFFFLHKYVMKQEVKYCLLGGLSLGVALLMKWQTSYFLPATLFIFTGLLGSRRLRVIATYLLSLLVGFLFILVPWQAKSFFADLPLSSQILASLFVFGMTTLVVVAMEYRAEASQTGSHRMFHIIEGALVLSAATVLVAGIWFMRNYVLTGSLLWNSGIKLDSYQWAINFISASGQARIPLLDIGAYLFSLVLIPFTVNVLGTWVIPVLIGMAVQARANKKSLLMVIWMMGYFIGYFWSTFQVFWFYYASVNERDLWIFAPFFALFAAFGINYVAEHLAKNHNEALTSFLLISMGLLSLIQSNFLFYYAPTDLRAAFVYLSGLLGSSWQAIVWQSSRQTQLSFLPSILFFIFVASVLILGVLFLGVLIARLVKSHLKVKLRLGIPFNNRVKKTLLVIAVSSLLVAPYVWSTYEFSGGDLRNFSQNQLQLIPGLPFNGLYQEVAPYLDSHAKDGDIVLMADSLSLQYYLHRDIKVITLDQPGNLGVFRSLIEANDSSAILNSLSELGVRYVLLCRWETAYGQYLLDNLPLFDIVRDPRYFQVTAFSYWYLYEFIQGKEQIVIGWKDDSFTSNWTYAPLYSTSNASWSFASDGDVVNVTIAGNSTGCFEYVGIPPINTTEYSYVACRVKGSSNARWLFRLLSQGEKIRYDFPQWWAPSDKWETLVFSVNGTPLSNQLFGQRAFFAIQSVDGNPATLYIDFYMIFKYEAI